MREMDEAVRELQLARWLADQAAAVDLAPGGWAAITDEAREGWLAMARRVMRREGRR